MQHRYILIFTMMFSLLGNTCNSNRPDVRPHSVVDAGDGRREKHPACEKLAFQLSSVINDITSEIRLRSLAKTTGENNSEFRLWTNVGNFFEKVLVVRRSGNKSDASFFDIERPNDSLKFKKKILTTPRSGWDNFFATIQNNDIVVPLKLSFDQLTRPIRDEGVILLEILDHGKYDFVYCGQYTSSGDGKKLLDLCEYFALEFDVDLDCLGKHSSP